MKKTIIIKKNYEFKSFFSKGKFYYGEYIHMYIHKNKLNINKLGVAVSKKLGKSVKRNRVKRLIKENYRIYENNMKIGFNILIILNKDRNIENISFNNIKEDFFKILKKAEIVIDSNNL